MIRLNGYLNVWNTQIKALKIVLVCVAGLCGNSETNYDYYQLAIMGDSWVASRNKWIVRVYARQFPTETAHLNSNLRYFFIICYLFQWFSFAPLGNIPWCYEFPDNYSISHFSVISIIFTEIIFSVQSVIPNWNPSNGMVKIIYFHFKSKKLNCKHRTASRILKRIYFH